MSGNVPIVFPPIPIRDNFQPRAHLIADVSIDEFAVVTTTVDHGYIDDMYVRIYVPPIYGMNIPYTQTMISVLSPTQFLTFLDTRAQQPFVAPGGSVPFTPAQVVPISGPFQNIAPR